MNGLCVNPCLSGVPACPAGPRAPAGGPPPGETPVRDAPCPAQRQLGLWLSVIPLGWRGGLLMRWGGRKALACRAPAPAKNAAAWRRKKRPPLLGLFYASGRSNTQENNSQLSGCDFNIVRIHEDQSSTPAPDTTFSKNRKKRKSQKSAVSGQKSNSQDKKSSMI